MSNKVKTNSLKDKYSALYNQKADELKFKDVIDDNYTNSVMNKYQKGHQKNKWFVWSGYLSIVFGIFCLFIMIIVGANFISKSDHLKELAIFENYDYEKKKAEVIAVCIIMPIIGILALLVGFKIKSFSSYTREMLMKKTTLVMTFAVLQIFVGGLIFSILTFAGYFVGRGIDYGAIYYNRIEEYSLEGAKKSTNYKELRTIEDSIFDDNEENTLEDENN